MKFGYVFLVAYWTVLVAELIGDTGPSNAFGNVPRIRRQDAGGGAGWPAPDPHPAPLDRDLEFLNFLYVGGSNLVQKTRTGSRSRRFLEPFPCDFGSFRGAVSNRVV